MQRLRLKADGRIVEIRDGKEFPLAPSTPVASAAPNRVARSAPAAASRGYGARGQKPASTGAFDTGRIRGATGRSG